ncbi:hypothetical protein X946_5806 [Burkholderia sp. ABCPW 111]|nr:hypothetical protein X946_5806 [Burkholderia sp. ABCPW 111]
MPQLCLKEGQNRYLAPIPKSLTYGRPTVDRSNQAPRGFTIAEPLKNLTFGNFFCGKLS